MASSEGRERRSTEFTRGTGEGQHRIRWWHRPLYRLIPKCNLCRRPLDRSGLCWYHNP